MQRVMFIQLAVGLLIGGGVGAAMGYFGKCTTGACPLTANPVRGGLDRSGSPEGFGLLHRLASRDGPDGG
jgi:hypothetical protein